MHVTWISLGLFQHMDLRQQKLNLVAYVILVLKKFYRKHFFVIFYLFVYTGFDVNNDE